MAEGPHKKDLCLILHSRFLPLGVVDVITYDTENVNCVRDKI